MSSARSVLATFIALALGGSTTFAGVVAYYPFNNSAEEYTGNNIDLNLVGDATYAPSMNGGLGQALSLDGDGDGAIGANFVKISGNNMTGMAWVYATDLAGEWNSIVKNWGHASGGQFHFGVGSQLNDTLQNFLGSGTPAVGADPLPAGQWLHTAFVADATALEHRLYLNGQLIASSAYSGTLTPGVATGLGVGHKPTDDGTALANNGPGPWNGFIDEVALFDEALSQAQIEQIYRSGLAGYALSTTIPEPSSATLLLLAGLAAGGGRSWRRRTHSELTT